MIRWTKIGVVAFVLMGATAFAATQSTRWYVTPVSAGKKLVPTGVLLGVPFVPVNKPVENVTTDDPKPAQVVRAFYEAAAKGDEAALHSLVRIDGGGEISTLAVSLKAGIGDLQSPIVDGVIMRPAGRAAVVVRGTPVKGNAVRVHWLDSDGPGRYVVVQPRKPLPEDALISISLLATASDPAQFVPAPAPPAGANRQTVILKSEPGEPSLALRLNFEGIKERLSVFDPETKSSDAALQFYIDTYRALKKGDIAAYEAAVEASARARTTKAMGNLSAKDKELMRETLNSRTILYCMPGSHYEFVFFTHYAGPQAKSLNPLHEGVFKEDGSYALKPEAEIDTIDQIFSDADFQARVLEPLIYKIGGIGR